MTTVPFPQPPTRVMPIYPDWDDEGLTLGLGSADRTIEYPFLTQKEKAAWRREVAERHARRITPGFALPDAERPAGE